MIKDYYELLEIDKNATDDDIKKAFRKMSIKYHPDTNKSPDAEKQFREIKNAYDILSDNQKRYKYDKYIGFMDEMISDFDKFEKNFDHAYKYDKEDLDKRNKSNQTKQESGDTYFNKAADINILQELTFEEAILGCEKEIVSNSKKYSIKIPVGAPDGLVIRITGAGNVGENGKNNGDLLIKLKVLPHRLFRRIGQDIQTTISITDEEAYKGKSFIIELVDGSKETIVIEPNTYKNERIVIKGKGVPSFKGKPAGNLIVDLFIVNTDFAYNNNNNQNLLGEMYAKPIKSKNLLGMILLTILVIVGTIFLILYFFGSSYLN